MKILLFGLLPLIGLVIIVILFFLVFSPQFGKSPSGSQLAKIEKSKHYRSGKFWNLEPTVVMTTWRWSSLIKYFDSSLLPKGNIPVDVKGDDFFESLDDSVTRITWFGHSALLLEMEGKKIFLDPMLGDVPAPHPMLGYSRFNDTLPMSIDRLPALDAVVISHDHYDHLDYGSIAKIKDKVAQFYVPLGVDAHLISWGVDESKITALDWWESASLHHLKFTSTPARHFSGRGILDSGQTLWCSWVIQGTTHSIFFGGDSGYSQDFKKIGDLYGPFDLVMLECGQYNEQQWPEIHMAPEQTAQAAVDLRGKLLLPIHWGAFKLAIHGWKEPIQRVVKKANQLNIPITTPRIGQSIVLTTEIPASTWWKEVL